MDVVIQQVGEIGQSKKGNPQRSIKYEKGWLTLSGESKSDLLNLKEGQIVTVSDPTQFGKYWYAFLQHVQDPAVPKPAPDDPMAQKESTSLDWPAYIYAMRAAHLIAKELEPDDASARAALVNTAMIALTNGRISLPDDDVPF